MVKIHSRFVVFFIIPCLAGDALIPAGAATFEAQGAALLADPTSPIPPLRFNEEALALIPVWMHLATIRAAYQIKRKMGLRKISDILHGIAEIADKESIFHIDRVPQYAALIALALGRPHSYVSKFYAAGVLHDVGKRDVPEAILQKPGKPTAEERVLIERHPDVGRRIILGYLSRTHSLFEVAELLRASQLALEHHERWNGEGYPRGLKGSAISEQARILSIADVFDALTQDRPYRKAIPFDNAVLMIQECSGTFFDPHLVAVFSKPSTLVLIRKVYDQSPEGQRLKKLALEEGARERAHAVPVLSWPTLGLDMAIAFLGALFLIAPTASAHNGSAHLSASPLLLFYPTGVAAILIFLKRWEAFYAEPYSRWREFNHRHLDAHTSPHVLEMSA